MGASATIDGVALQDRSSRGWKKTADDMRNCDMQFSESARRHTGIGRLSDRRVAVDGMTLRMLFHMNTWFAKLAKQPGA